jgi:DUF971 family protein
MSAKESIEPVELRAPRDATTLEITWSDGATSRYRHALLRGFCPCAHCQGHQGPIGWAADARDADLAILDIEEVGNYAVRLVFADGHSTGIYSFRFLRDLTQATERPVEEAKLLRFSR